MVRIRTSEETKCSVSKRIIWRIAVYIRLSKEDGNDESMSVTNQKKIIKEYVEQSFDGEYAIEGYYIDDGLTGTDYERPGFQRMLRDMESGRVNCIICKNLSRMFRNYSDQGYFLEQVFPANKIRFIAVSDPKVDSFLHPETIQGLEVPINGLMNDRFAAKTSHDVRDTFATKRRRGEFIGAFAPYGYQKDPSNKNRLIIDEEAAQVVRMIFQWFVMEGMSKMGIAKRLNDSGFLNPAAYKRSKGLKFCNPNTENNDGFWGFSAIFTILNNRIYTGTMVQGRQTVVSYKVHNKVAVPKEDWYIVEDTHEAIVDQALFEKAQSLQKRDTRAAPDKREVHVLAGYIRCADCKKAMTRQKSKNIVYYYCRTFRDKSKELCTKHSIKEEVVKQVLLTIVQMQIDLIPDLSGIIAETITTPVVPSRLSCPAVVLKLRKRDLAKVTDLIDGLYEDWKNEDISKEEYHRMKQKYEKQADQLRQAILNIEEECRTLTQGSAAQAPDLADFLEYHKITAIERRVMVDLVKNIYVHENGEIEIEFKFADQHRR